MPETLSTKYQSFEDEDHLQMRVLGKTFFVHLAGKTNGAHRGVVKYLETIGKVQTESCAQSDFLVVFCPVVSRVGTDIEAALSDDSVLTDGKPAVLVVMHHTFDPHHVVAQSSWQVCDRRVWLTVDCLFYQDHLLPRCRLNDAMRAQVGDLLRSPSDSQASSWKKSAGCKCRFNLQNKSSVCVFSEMSRVSGGERRWFWIKASYHRAV
ncbi:uncharacterized protein AB9W97_003831 isoform 2-T2 [Spinachia spinachia]